MRIPFFNTHLDIPIPIPEYGVGTLIYIGIFLGVLISLEGLRQMFSRSEGVKDARNRRMRMIAKGATPEEVLELFKPTQAAWALRSVPGIGNLPFAMRQAGVTIRPAAFLFACVAAAVVLAGLASLYLPLLLSMSGGFAIGFVLPMLVLFKAGTKRMDSLTRQLPDALDLMARGLRVGHPLNSTIGSVAKELQDPIATEFGVMLDQISYGEELVDAFADFAERIDTEDARYLATSVAIQDGTGGDLASILNTLASVIRARMEMRKRIKAISAEGRATATFLSFLPFFIVGMSLLTAPNYYSGVSDDPLFKPLAFIAVALSVTNIVVMRKLVNFRF